MLYNPHWRAQWDHYESQGFPFEKMMHVIHNPPWIIPIIDAVTKNTTSLTQYQPSIIQLTVMSFAFVIWYALWSAFNFVKNGKLDIYFNLFLWLTKGIFFLCDTN